jgi:uncharacterized membrane protein YsdA (DUF1294 family)
MEEKTKSIRLDKKVKNALDEDFKKETPAIIGELAFISLPFIVILIVNLSKGDWIRLLQTSDWALAATLLFGQTIVKIIMGVAAREHAFHHQNFGLISALIIVLGLVPSILIVAIFQLNQDLSIGLVIAQFVLLGAAVYAFLLFGTIGQILYSNAFRHKISKILGLDKTEEK